MKQSVAECVARYLARRGVEVVFGVAGGASLHLLHAVARTPGIELVCPQHEQAAAMAADGYARMSGGLGAAIATSGPGATNLLTGIGCAFYDSIPVLFLTGQVSTFRAKGTLGVRQLGFQETDTVAVCGPLTKLAVRLERPDRIRFELERASWIATSGRPGPVLLDLPDDLQRELVDWDALEGFEPPSSEHPAPPRETLQQCADWIAEARRPVVVLGWGVRLAKAEKEALALVERLGFPVAPTWALADFLPAVHPLRIGTFGTHGLRGANFALQNADLVLAIGARLDTHETGSPPSSFARAARKVVVDIDPAELAKFSALGVPECLTVQADAAEFISALGPRLEPPSERRAYALAPWHKQIAAWRDAYPPGERAAAAAPDVAPNPYRFVAALSRALPNDAAVFLDTGCAIAWWMQGYAPKLGQRVFHDFNNTAMGYGLPASIGACYARAGRPVVCISGDGSLQMNVQELATAAHLGLPIKLFLLDNQGYAMIRQTQDQWLGSDYVGSSAQGGLACPNLADVAAAYGVHAFSVERDAALEDAIGATLAHPGPVLCRIAIPAEAGVVPQVQYGRPIEDATPLLPRREFARQMLIEPLPVSLEELP